MPQTTSRRRRRPGKAAVSVARLVGERRRLLAIRDEITTAFEAEVCALHAAWIEQVTRIDAQLRDLDRGVLPQPGGEDDGEAWQPGPAPNGRIATQPSGGGMLC